MSVAALEPPTAGVVQEPLLAASDAWQPQPYRFSVESYHSLGEIGILTPTDRLELLDGKIFYLSPIGIRHAVTVSWLGHRFAQESQDRFLIYPGNPLRLNDYSEPQPDFMLIPFRRSMKEAPRPDDVFLLVEVSDSTLARDRSVKLKLYAEASIAEYWIINLQNDCLEVFTEPAGGSYRQSLVLTGDQRVSSRAFPDISLTVDAMIPPR